jgi:hypothetical protein
MPVVVMRRRDSALAASLRVPQIRLVLRDRAKYIKLNPKLEIGLGGPPLPEG